MGERVTKALPLFFSFIDGCSYTVREVAIVRQNRIITNTGFCSLFCLLGISSYGEVVTIDTKGRVMQVYPLEAAFLP